MKMNLRAIAVTSGLLWGGAVLTVGLANIVKPGYGKRFLEVVASIYPGYHARPNVKDVAVGTAYAVLDGAVGGAVFSAVYNRMLREPRLKGSSPRAA